MSEISANRPPVAGHCPACGGETLFLGHRGVIKCAPSTCSNRDAAAQILADPETGHIVTRTVSSVAIRHPLVEHIGDELLTCDLHMHLTSAWFQDAMPDPGRYRAWRDAAGQWQWEEMSDA